MAYQRAERRAEKTAGSLGQLQQVFSCCLYWHHDDSDPAEPQFLFYREYNMKCAKIKTEQSADYSFTISL